MSGLTPKKIVDVNGKATTVHVNPDKGATALSTKRAGSIPVSPSVEDRDVSTYTFISETAGFATKDHFDVRDVKDAFDSYAVEIDDHIAQYKDVAAVDFDEEDGGEFTDLKQEAAKWCAALDSLGVVSAPAAPEGENMKEWSDHLFAISTAWNEVGNERSVTLTNETALAELAEDQAREFGYLDRGTPSYITNHIDWDAVGEELKTGAPSMKIDDSTFYLV